MVYSPAAFWAATSNLICRLTTTAISAHGFQGENLRRYLGLAERLPAVATALHATSAQAAIAWVAAQGNDIIPLIGARSRLRLAEALGSVDLELTASDISRLSPAIPNHAAAGDAFPVHQRRAGADDATSPNTERSRYVRQMLNDRAVILS
jgi:aryl-alcohol dehydrogenase-like predicted oxidoreductase